jgi:hypothetical protein
LHLRRAKNGVAATHPLLGDELRALRMLNREAKSAFLFVSERGAPFTVSGLQNVVERAGIAAKMPFKVHPTCFDTRPATFSPIKGRIRDVAKLLGTSIDPIDRPLHGIGTRSFQKSFGGKHTLRYVRFTPKSGHWNSTAKCPLCAKSGRSRDLACA